MANQVYANNMEVSCKAAAGKSICAFPDVCFTPPQTPATPPGVPLPYPNTGMASDTTDGSTSVKISGKEVMLKNKSYYKKSTGDEAGCAPKKGLLTSVNRGKVYFVKWSMDVKIEAENVVRHLDLTTHNHNPPPGQTPPFPNLDEMMVDGRPCSEILKDEDVVIHRHGSKRCPKGSESDHILQNACFENARGGGGISTAPDYSHRDAPCICLKGASSKKGTEHYKKTQAQRAMRRKWRKRGKAVTFEKVRKENLKAMNESRRTPLSPSAAECIERVVDHYFRKYLGLKNDTPVRVPRSGRFRKPSISA